MPGGRRRGMVGRTSGLGYSTHNTVLWCLVPRQESALAQSRHACSRNDEAHQACEKRFFRSLPWSSARLRPRRVVGDHWAAGLAPVFCRASVLFPTSRINVISRLRDWRSHTKLFPTSLTHSLVHPHSPPNVEGACAGGTEYWYRIHCEL